MKYYLLAIAAAVAVASGASAQDHQQGSHNPAVKDSSAHTIAKPAEGANSFTEDQALGRLTKAGYTVVAGLMKDGQGVWRGTAMKGGKKVKVGLDYKGNVTHQ